MLLFHSEALCDTVLQQIFELINTIAIFITFAKEVIESLVF